MNIPLFCGLAFSLIAFSLWLGRSPKKESKNNEDFFLMGRQLGLFSLVMTLLATQIGGGALMGSAEEAYAKGWKVFFYPLGMVLGMLLLGLGYGARLRRLNLTTVPEIFEKIYQAPSLRKVASFLSIAALFFILVAQGIAAKKFFFSLGFTGNYLFIGFWLALVGYTVMGGLRAVVKTDILQATFIFISLGLAISATLYKPLPVVSVTSPLLTGTAPWLTWLLMPLFFMLIEQDMGQRCFAAKNPQTVTLAALITAVLILAISIVPIYFGLLAGKYGVPIEAGQSVLLTAVQFFTNPICTTFVSVAILMAIISTADSLLCSISSNISCDFRTLNRSVFFSQSITFLVGITALALTFFFDNVVSMLMFSYQISVSVLFVPVTLAVWKKNPQSRSALLSMVTGGGAFLLFSWISPPFPKELLATSLSGAAFFLGEQFFKKPARLYETS